MHIPIQYLIILCLFIDRAGHADLRALLKVLFDDNQGIAAGQYVGCLRG
jgi:hypothetical protein